MVRLRPTKRIDLLQGGGGRLWYRVTYDADIRDGQPHIPSVGGVPLTDVAHALPHGSGLDSNWHINLRRDGGLSLRTEWHTMNEHGYYMGYYPVLVVVDAQLEVVKVTVNQRYCYGVDESIGETVEYNLGQLRRKASDGLCPVCGKTIILTGGLTTDNRLIGSCGDAFTARQWHAKDDDGEGGK